MRQNTLYIGYDIFVSNMNHIYPAMRQYCVTTYIGSDYMSVTIYFNDKVFLRAEEIANSVFDDRLATELIPRKL